LLQVLATQGYDCPPAVFDVERLKDECGVVYLTNGIDSLREIPTPASTSAFRTRSWRRCGVTISRRYWMNLFRESGFYTNRIRFAEMLVLFERAGFSCRTPRVVRWDRLPTPRAKLAAPFSQMPDDSLLVSGFDAVLRPRQA